MDTGNRDRSEDDSRLMKQADSLLRRIFGYSRYRKGQREIIATLLERRDVFAMMPTGSGKSLCYQLPGYLLPGLVLIVSPLLALMEDQADALRRIGEKRVRALNSMLHPRERDRVLSHLDHIRFLFISPEMLRRKIVLHALERAQISLFVVDEAHCVSQWGHEFRPDYLHLREVREQIGHPVCLALTATANSRMRQDIVSHLGLEHARQILMSVDRPNIALLVREVENNSEKVEQLVDLVGKVALPGLVYCATRDWTEKLSGILRIKGGLRTAFYHGGMTAEDRRKIQDQFINGELDILCCTNAFGMGINKPDVRLVVHFHYPPHLNAYLQEIGRVSRDGRQGLAVLFHASDDDRIPAAFIDSSFPDDPLLTGTLEKLDRGILSLQDEDRFLKMVQGEGASETAARFLWEQAGAKPAGRSYLSILDACRRHIKKRRRVQLEDLARMRAWIAGEECRRASCLRFFDERLVRKPDLCCDRCGTGVEDFLRDRKAVGTGSPRELHWAPRLRLLLGIEHEKGR